MRSPRWRKVLHDLWGNKMRTLLVILTISVGVFAIGYVSNMLFIALPDMNADYLSSNPHAAQLFTDLFDDDLLSSLQKVPGVGDLEGRAEISQRVFMPNGEKRTIQFSAIPSIEDIRVDQMSPEGTSSLPPLKKGEIYLEKSGGDVLGVKTGDHIRVEMPDGATRSLKVTGIVHSVNAIPYLFSNQVYAYTNLDTVIWLGGPDDYNRLYMTVTERKTDEAYIRQVAEALAEKFEDSGRSVYFTFIFSPGRHFASDITAALAAVMMVLGGLSVFLGALLVINTITALLSQQMRQIGVMKAIGAGTGQLLVMYLAVVLSFGLISLALMVPLGTLLSRLTGGGISSMLNFRPGPFRFSPATLFLQSLVALVVPLLATIVPVINGTRITVREAITNYGLGRGNFGSGLVDRMVERIRGLPRPLLISLRNTFRRKARLALTLASLVLAGAIFIGVINLRASINKTIDDVFGYFISDVIISFARPYPLQRVLPLALTEHGVTGGESWGGSMASLLTPDESSGTQINLMAPPADSKLVEPMMTAGRWLRPEDQNALVIGNHLIAERPELKLGDQVTLLMNDKKSTWTIVGIFRMPGNSNPPPVYTNQEYLARLLHQGNQVFSLRLTTARHDAVSQKHIARELENIYQQAGIDVSGIIVSSDLIQANVSTTGIIIQFLLVMALLIAIVGGLGLTSAMSLNVIERTREIGVMRAIGASNGAMMQMVIVEGMVVGIISWILGAILAVPIGNMLAYSIGVSMFRTPLDPLFSIDGLVIWLALVLIISTIASILPARNAVRLTVREVLAYE